MRILWLKADLLLPLDKGGKLRTWHLMRHLAKRHAITYLSFAEPGQPIDGMYEVAERVEVIERSDPAKASLRFYADAASHLLDPLPYAVGKYRSRAYARKVRQLLDEASFDLVVCDFLPPAVNLPTRLPCPAAIFTHNVESEIWRRHAHTRSGLSRFLYAGQHRRMLRFEAAALARFDGVLTVSQCDSDTIARLYPASANRPVAVVPTGVDTAFFTADPSPAASRQLVFTGSMDWLPNEDAMTFFCREVFPLIRSEEPDATLAIVGRAPTPAVQRLASIDGVTVTGRVDDVRPHMREAAAYIVPLRIGGGTRLKIFEAMAMGKAVVSTTIGAEGLPVTDGHHLLIADSPAAFAARTLDVLRNLPQRRRLEESSRALVVARYDWAVAAGVLEEALIEIAGRTGTSRCRTERIVATTNAASEPASGDRRWGWGPNAG
jgi:sugar transferase (PEP-CTERM/EpsH1 system associated)